MAGLHLYQKEGASRGDYPTQKACLKRVAWRKSVPPSLRFLASHRLLIAVTGQNSCSRGLTAAASLLFKQPLQAYLYVSCSTILIL
jgi:hypothetical protein